LAPYCKLDSQKIDELWKTYAHEYLRSTQHLPEIIPWNYNRWFVDLEYRKSLSAALGLEFTDAGKEVVGRWGSSFDDRRFDGSASRMKVLERWNKLKQNPDYLDLFDEELVELSRQIFDFAPEKLLKRIELRRTAVKQEDQDRRRNRNRHRP